jgi:hypothetical protein
MSASAVARVLIVERSISPLRECAALEKSLVPKVESFDGRVDGLKNSTSSLLSIIKTRLVPALSIHAVLIGASQFEPFGAERGSTTVESVSSIRGDARRRLLKGLVARRGSLRGWHL